MRIGIVGNEGLKFTGIGEERAKSAICGILDRDPDPIVVSGRCHLGGIDIWAEEVADSRGYRKDIFPPAEHNWERGYKPRNLQIARNSDIVYCIAVDKLPKDFPGMVFGECYHCRKAGRDLGHVKSGGCWTALQALKMGKQAEWIVIDNE